MQIFKEYDKEKKKKTHMKNKSTNKNKSSPSDNLNVKMYSIQDMLTLEIEDKIFIVKNFSSN